MEILFEDRWLIVCIKPAGVLSEEFGRGRCMPQLLKKETGAYKIDVVHRLDKPAAGLMVFSKHPKATAALSRQIADRQLTKEYLAVVGGCPQKPEGTWTDFLFRDKTKNKSFVVKTLRRGAKEASLSYRLLETVKTPETALSLLHIRLHTGRTHQIRVQCASRGMPLFGDGKYGSACSGQLALWSYRLCFAHPITGETVDLFALPKKAEPWNAFQSIQSAEKTLLGGFKN